MKRWIWGCFLSILIGTSGLHAQEKTHTRFSLLSPEQSGVDFQNTLTDEKDHSILIYSNYYGGAGVGVGDFNQDGLPDLYFAGNLVGDRLYLNKGNLRFEDITQQAGIQDNGGWSSGVVVVDIDQDGDEDIYVTRELYDDQPALRSNVLWINNGDLTFTEKASTYGIADSHRTRHATFLDYDRDGDVDLFCLNQPPNPGNFSPLAGSELYQEKFSPRLYRNNGPDQAFTDVTKEAGMIRPGFANSLSACDFNQDGWTDIYVANDFDAADRLWINNTDGTFSNVIDSAMGHISFYSMGVDAADINHDGLLDLMVLDMVAEDNYRIKANMSGMNPEAFWDVLTREGHYQYMFNTLQLNQGIDQTGSIHFSDIAQLSGMSSTDWSWSNLMGDFDNDGYQDAYVTNGLIRDIRNTDGDKAVSAFIYKTIEDFVKANPNAGEVSIWDILDLDKALELLPSAPLKNFAYRNNGDLTFDKISEDWGLDEESFSNGSAYADLDADGDLDLIVNNLNSPAFIYRNNSDEGNWLRIDLKSRRNILGTKVEIFYGEDRQFAELTNVRGMYSSSEKVLHFGMGKTEKVDRLLLTWPDGKVEERENVSINQLLTFTYENAPVAYSEKEPLTYKFEEVTAASGISFRHVENEFDDYKKEVLLPHKQSQFGPALATGDVNGDGRDDLFVGGAIRQAGALYFQTPDGTFVPVGGGPWTEQAAFEDVGAALFDADNDGDLDLYVSSGGNEYPVGSKGYQDRLYRNLGNAFEYLPEALPEIAASGGRVKPFDFDGDGDLDLFVAGRLLPQSYPSPADSYLLRNDSEKDELPRFTDVTRKVAPDLLQLGMVTDAVWVDVTGDHQAELVVVGEWMPVTVFQKVGDKFENITESMGLGDQTGWWYSLAASDLDGDGDQDLIAGNLGLNYKYQAKPDQPFSVHYDDFDNNGSYDIVLSYYNYGEQYPLRGRSCSSEQIPDLKNKFPTYHDFASANLADVYGIKNLNRALHYEAKTFASTWFENTGGKGFTPHILPNEAQISSVNDIIVEDVDQDGYLDLILAGNLYVAEIETPRNDAGMGLWLKGSAEGVFVPVSPSKSGLFLPYDVKALKMVPTPIGRLLLAASNDDALRVIKIE